MSPITPRSTRSQLAANAARKSTPRVLIADDDPVFRAWLGEFVRAFGWAAIPASDAMQAVMYAVRGAPDVVLLDISMPGGSGVVALERLRANALTTQVPVVVITGGGDPDAERRSWELGVRAFLRKPVDPIALRAAIAAAMEQPAAA